MPLETNQFRMRDGPGSVGTSTAALLLCLNATAPAPLPASEFRTPDDAGELTDGVPLTHLLAFEQQRQEHFHVFKTLLKLKGHAAPHVFLNSQCSRFRRRCRTWQRSPLPPY